jgi:hypothetical protein
MAWGGGRPVMQPPMYCLSEDAEEIGEAEEGEDVFDDRVGTIEVIHGRAISVALRYGVASLDVVRKLEYHIVMMEAHCGVDNIPAAAIQLPKRLFHPTAFDRNLVKYLLKTFVIHAAKRTITRAVRRGSVELLELLVAKATFATAFQLDKDNLQALVKEAKTIAMRAALNKMVRSSSGRPT